MNDKIRILMVDDEERFRETTDNILKRRGFETLLAESGEAAIEKLDLDPDVVLLDIKMKGLDGHATLREFKRKKPYLPVILLTGQADLAAARQAREEGAYDFLFKPCDIDILDGKVRDAARHGRMEPAAMENIVFDVMIPVSQYPTLPGDWSVRDAVFELGGLSGPSGSDSPAGTVAPGIGHPDVLIIDARQNIIGILTVSDLMRMIIPSYLSVPKPTTASSIQYSRMFWRGMFQDEVSTNATWPIAKVMSPAPRTIGGTASLMEAAYMMSNENVHHLIVEYNNKVVGVIREQDLFREMEKILRSSAKR